jgi:hypothetical protein
MRKLTSMGKGGDDDDDEVVVIPTSSSHSHSFRHRHPIQSTHSAKINKARVTRVFICGHLHRGSFLLLVALPDLMLGADALVCVR